MLDVAIIGSGPYGISLAAHIQEKGLNYELLGYPMDFWKNKMSPEMFIRTQLKYIGLSDPHDRYTFEKYQEDKQLELPYPVPRTIWVDYALWFAEKTKIKFNEQLVTSINKTDKGFCLRTETGRQIITRHIIVAVGLTNAEFIPPNLQHLPPELISHSSVYTSYESFSGKKVVVLGGGQSGWEAAALLHQAGADVELTFRGSGYEPPVENINERQRDLADKFYFLPEKEKDYLRKELLKATVTEFLLPLVKGKVRLRPYSDIICAKQVQKTGKLEIVFRNGERLEVDHMIAATGYCSSVDKIMFLKPILPIILKEDNGFPKVDEYFESSVEGLYFVGPLSSYHHGPTYTQIAGVWHTSKTILSSLLKQRYKTSITPIHE